MKSKVMAVSLGLALLIALSGYSQSKKDTDQSGRDEFRGPGMMNDWDNGGRMRGPGFNQDRYSPMWGGEGMMVMFFVPEARTIIESYGIKIQKVFLDAREAKLKFMDKRRDLKQKLDALVVKYADDKTVSKDIVSALRDMQVLQYQVQAINKEAMKKIQDLNDAREKELKTALDNWVNKLDKDSKELDKFVDSYKDHPRYRPDKK